MSVFQSRMVSMRCIWSRFGSITSRLAYSSHIGGHNDKEEYFSVTRSTLGRSEEEKERDVEIALPEMLKIYHCRRDIKCSPIKMNMIARQIRRLPIDEAIKQLEFSPKRAAITIKEVILEAQSIAVEKYEIEDKSNMWLALSYVGRGNYIRRVRYHGKGMFGKMYEYYCHYFVMLQEGDPVLKNSRVRRWQMPELEEKKRHPARILHSHTWW